MMSKMTGYHVKKYAESDIITLCEPCCGNGGMIIAFAEALLEQKIKYQRFCISWLLTLTNFATK